MNTEITNLPEFERLIQPKMRTKNKTKTYDIFVLFGEGKEKKTEISYIMFIESSIQIVYFLVVCALEITSRRL